MNGIEEFSKNMEIARKKAKMMQKDVAEKTGLTRATISAYESAQKSPTLENALKIAEALHTTVDALCGINPVSAPKTYTDFLKTFLGIAEILGLCLCTDETSQEYNGNCLTYDNETVANFMADWMKIKKLLSDGTIDQELYEAWKLKKWHDYSNIPFYKDDGEINDADKEKRKKEELKRMGYLEFKPSADDDDDLPF